MFQEDARLTRECWRDASGEDRISVLCPGCGASIEIRTCKPLIDCAACGTAIPAPQDNKGLPNAPHSDKTAPTSASMTLPIESRA